MASLNKLRVKKLYLPSSHGTKKGFGSKSTLVTATADELNQLDGGSYDGLSTGITPGSVGVNAIPANGLLDITGVSVDEDIVTIGADVYELNDVEGQITAGRIWIDLGDTNAGTIVAALVAAVNASATEAVTAVAGLADTVEIYSDVAGVIGNAIVTTTDITNAAWDAAVLENGLDGTVGLAGDMTVGALGTYTCTADNTIADANWAFEAHAPHQGSGVEPQTFSVSTALGDADFRSDVIFLDGTDACVITEWTPALGVTYTLQCIDSTADPSVTLSTGLDFNANGDDTITFPDADDTIVCKMVAADRMVILSNEGGVTLS